MRSAVQFSSHICRQLVSPCRDSSIERKRLIKNKEINNERINQSKREISKQRERERGNPPAV
jgi:hypothetical protein